MGSHIKRVTWSDTLVTNTWFVDEDEETLRAYRYNAERRAHESDRQRFLTRIAALGELLAPIWQYDRRAGRDDPRQAHDLNYTY